MISRTKRKFEDKKNSINNTDSEYYSNIKNANKQVILEFVLHTTYYRAQERGVRTKRYSQTQSIKCHACVETKR